jgi:hypothetical protein
MGYYTRIFCKSSSIPSISEIISHLNKFGNRTYQIEDYSGLLDSNEWKNFHLKYKEDKLPLLIEINRIYDEDGLAKEEIDEFLEQIGSQGLSLSKRKLIWHLKATNYIVVSQLPTSDIDDDGYNANGEFLNYFASNFEGIIQADREGFYDGSKLIVRE